MKKGKQHLTMSLPFSYESKTPYAIGVIDDIGVNKLSSNIIEF
jgi:hypothetical protein